MIGLSATMAQDIVPAAATLSPEAHLGKVVGTVMTGLLLGILLSRVVSGFVAEHGALLRSLGRPAPLRARAGAAVCRLQRVLVHAGRIVSSAIALRRIRTMIFGSGKTSGRAGPYSDQSPAVRAHHAADANDGFWPVRVLSNGGFGVVQFRGVEPREWHNSPQWHRQEKTA